MGFHQDLDAMTRDLHDATFEAEYMQKTPVLSLILERKSVKFNGGKYYYREVDTGTTEDLAQDFANNDTLSHGVMNTVQDMKFKKKNFQLPVQIDLDEELENALDNEDGSQLQNLAAFRNKKTQEAGRLHLRKKIYGGASESSKSVQGLNSALDITSGATTEYAGLSRSTTVNPWLMPADNRYTNSTQATQYYISLDWLDEVMDPLSDLEDDGNTVTIVGPTLFLALKQEAAARSMPITVNKGLAKFNITDITIGNRRIIRDPFLQTKYNASMGLTTGSAGALEKRVYGLNLDDWDLYVHPNWFFRLTDPFDQSQIAGGSWFKLARLYFSGNLVCWHPNRQLYLNYVSA